MPATEAERDASGNQTKRPGIYVIYFEIIDFTFKKNRIKHLCAFIVPVQALGTLEIPRALLI